jgi:hypothetical protein
MSVIIKPAQSVVPAIVASLSGDVSNKIVLAVQAQTSADGKWLTAADALYMKGVRFSMLEKDGDADIIAKVDSIIVTAFPERIQQLLAMTSLIGMEQIDRDIRKAYIVKVGQHRGTLRKHLKAHEEKESGKRPTVALSASLVKDIQAVIDRIKKAPESKIDFHVDDVIQHLKAAITELT